MHLKTIRGIKMYCTKGRDGQDFYLHKMDGKNLFYFSSQKKGALQDIPEGYALGGVNSVTGLPYIKMK